MTVVDRPTGLSSFSVPSSGRLNTLVRCAVRRDGKDGQSVVFEAADDEIGGAADRDRDGVDRPVQLHRAGIRHVEHVGQVAVRRDRVHADAVVMESGDEHIGVAADRRRRQPLRALDLRRGVVGHVVDVGQRAVRPDREHAHAVVVDAAGKQIGRAADHHRLDIGGERELQRRVVADIRHVGQVTVGGDGKDAHAGVVHAAPRTDRWCRRPPRWSAQRRRRGSSWRCRRR